MKVRHQNKGEESESEGELLTLAESGTVGHQAWHGWRCPLTPALGEGGEGGLEVGEAVGELSDGRSIEWIRVGVRRGC